uniref:Phospholipid methyltransferase n=1 Tax=Candidatus Kentrum sp. SD TaxID=2126332 RepID=A0A450YJ00_9GAMM|nr:MAG: Phospholipid methyltransferase [Candidatus Kentron sp. SD]VFK41527.1 MAG: Phospholipid methyltransferase [Candidatus Kentron sp. SD]
MRLSTSMKLAIYVLAGFSFILGFGSLITFGVFLYTGPFPMIALPLNATEVLIFDLFLCFAFISQHSGMIRIHAKKKIPRKNFKAVFAIVSGIALLAFILLWQESPFLIASADGFPRALLRTIFALGIAGQIWTTLSLMSVDPFGVQALMARLDPKEGPTGPATATAPISITGAYGWVRHPAYFTMLLLIWSQPDLTADRLMLNIALTVWVIIGTLLEERDLVGIFGEDYRAYQRMVPMLIPYRKPNRQKSP